VRELFGQMVRNAQTLDRLVRHAAIHVDEGEVIGFAETLSHLSAVTAQQTAKLHVLAVEHGFDRRLGERRAGIERRSRI
jgi:hypothetical protein